MNRIDTLESLRLFAKRLAGRLAKRQVLLLDGPMGAGKTQLTRFLLEELGSEETVSPTFAIHNEYATSRGRVDHVDLFRLENEDELESTGFWDLFAQSEGLVIIEWAERLPKDSLPRSWARMHLRLKVEPDGARVIEELN